jgi:phage baseplate assembly protein gpV
MKKLLPLVVLLGSCCTASAFRIEYGNTVNITRPVYEDLFIAAGTITISAPIYGDLIIAGGTVIISDTVTNDILLAGGTVTFNGFVGDDIRCAGGNIRISKNVTGDVVSAGGNIIIDRGVTIDGLLTSGGNITVDGNINGEVKSAFGTFILNGSIAKDMDCRGGKLTVNGIVGGKAVLSATDIVIGNDAAFNNDVRYWNKKGKLDFKQSLKNGKAVYDASLQMKTGQWYYLGAATVIGLLWYLGMALLMIMIVQYLFGNTLKKAADTVFNNAVKCLGYGFLYFIAVPIAAVIAFITVIGVPVGVLLVFGYVALLMLASVITSLAVAHWFNNRNNYQWHYWRLVFAAFGIFILLKLISSTPFIGWLLILLLTCMVFGGILLNINWKRKQPLDYTPIKINNPL